MMVAIAKRDHRHERPTRRHTVERIFERCRIRQHQRALAEITQQQRRQDQPEPCPSDRSGADVAHICIESLAAGKREEHRADDCDRDSGIGGQEARGLQWIERLRDGRCIPNIDQPKRRDGDKPDDHDGSEQPADIRSSSILNGEQADQDRERDRQDQDRE
jgi:hypothetical protein